MKKVLALFIIAGIFSFSFGGERQDAYNKGHQADNEEKYEEAIKWFTKALELCKEDEKIPKCWAYNNIGYIYIKLKNYDEALKNLELAVKCSDKIEVAWNNLGVVYENFYYKTNDIEYLVKAKEAYMKASALKPEQEKFKLNKLRVETLIKVHE